MRIAMSAIYARHQQLTAAELGAAKAIGHSFGPIPAELATDVGASV